MNGTYLSEDTQKRLFCEGWNPRPAEAWIPTFMGENELQ